jgi:hypothetical protein
MFLASWDCVGLDGGGYLGSFITLMAQISTTIANQYEELKGDLEKKERAERLKWLNYTT